MIKGYKAKKFYGVPVDDTQPVPEGKAFFINEENFEFPKLQLKPLIEIKRKHD